MTPSDEEAVSERILEIGEDDLVREKSSCMLQLALLPSLPSITRQEVDLTHGRLKAIPEVVATLRKVEVLSLRQNLIPDMEPLSGLTALRELDLYDNELTTVAGLDNLTQLTYATSVILRGCWIVKKFFYLLNLKICFLEKFWHSHPP